MIGPCEAAVDAHARLNDPGVDYDKQWQPEIWQAPDGRAAQRPARPRRARGHLCSPERALELSAPTSTMTRTLLNIDAAACSHHDGDTEQACRRTVAALTALPPNTAPAWSTAAPWTCTRRSPPSTTANAQYGNYATS
ncbi:hypothetical protein [Streptomyces rishiriensis]|uniref:hypothetical protein n=1 Tax=Streptomyces rishiriensis TaxID=68264 RepID=UPI0037CDA001